MAFRLIDGDWHKVMREAAKYDRSALRVVCPFIKLSAARKLIEAAQAKSIQVITRYRLQDFYDGVSDVSALRLFLEHGAEIRGVKGLHAKLFLFGKTNALVTSANLTLAALQSNHELGFLSDDQTVVQQCRHYFDDLWKRAGVDSLSKTKLDQWDQKVTDAKANTSRAPKPKGLGDEGADVGLTDLEIDVPDRVVEAPQAFVKFFGDSANRSDRSREVLELVDGAGCHWACTYPKEKRPRRVEDGALMFMARLAQSPNDIIVFGRAIGMAYVEGRDDASEADLKSRPWKEKWPRYIRVHHPEFVSGTLGNGVPLSRLMDELGANAFVTTQENAKQGKGNVDPKKAYMRLPDVQLSREGQEWMTRKLEAAFREHGKLTSAQIRTLDEPKVRADEEE